MLLNKLGYDAGTPDGHMDARTREAILSFERNNGLRETGKVTIQLVTVLERLQLIRVQTSKSRPRRRWPAPPNSGF